jgi:cell division inhibitor SepF
VNNIWTKLKDFAGFNEAEESEEYEYYEEESSGDDYQSLYQEQNPQPAPATMDEEAPTRRRPRERTNFNPEITMESPATPRSNVIGMPGMTNGVSEVVVVDPRSFEEMPQVIQALRERRTVVLNLTMMDPDEAQRAVDFVAGGTYAIDGHQERIGESIFLFTPSCVQVTTQSGVVHEVAPPPKAQPRTTTPTPAWAAEQSRMAQ